MRTLIGILTLALVPVAAAAADRPEWAFPPKQPGPAVVLPADDGKPKSLPGSPKTYTQKEIDSQMAAPDWYPDEHPALPHIVSSGNGTTVRACAGCHLTHGHGHPENSRLPGGTAAYLTRQFADFKSGARKGEGAGNMIKFAQSISAEDLKAATEYFAGLKPMKWTRVMEVDTVPKSFFKGTRRLPIPNGGTEPLGNRIIELPEDMEHVEMRDPHSSFISYVPMGSVAKGQALVTAGGGGKTIPCAICHGPGLKGLGDVPALAGRSPGMIARQLYYMQNGDRSGPSMALMKAVVDRLNGDDLLAISAYVASLDP